MKIRVLLLAILLCSVFAISSNAQRESDNTFFGLEIITTLQRPPQVRYEKSSQIKDIQVFGASSGIAFTADTLFRTDDNGETWREIVLPRNFNETISVVSFLNETSAWIVLTDTKNARLKLFYSQDGEKSWTQKAIDSSAEDLAQANLEKVSLNFENEKGWLTIDLVSSSNFKRYIYYHTKDSGETWERGNEQMEKRNYEERFDTLKDFGDIFKTNDKFRVENFNSSAESIIKHTFPAHYNSVERHSDWLVTSEGNCEGIKIGCVQISRLYKIVVGYENDKTDLSTIEITPPNIKELSKIETDKAKREAQNSIFNQPPNGNTRVSLNRGFDKCTAATASQMQTWWDNSPFYDANIYISGRNRGCSQPQLTAAWVNTVAAQGWGLIPTIVGYQSPCVASTSTTLQKHSSDPAVAETQGRGEADIAIADANALGLTQGTILYYDMERYDDTSGTGACSTPTKAFLKGWTDRVKELGYISGVYGSPTNAVGDWVNIPLASRMDAVWLARWDNVPSVWTYAAPSPLVPETAWANHQRIKQWQAPHNETWGGVTFNIDGNIADAPVAANPIAKNKTADFDGDGRSDISVWRPDTGVWYITNSSNATYKIQGFGLSTDILSPGDFDGDGKTDLAVFRPSDGVWHLYSRSIYRSFQFGSANDIPVPADYDGDGRTDIAVFRPSTGVWYIWNSFDSRGTSYTIQQFGLNGDKPVQADYDGDGKADLAVWRPSDGNWYLQRSTQGFTAINFGFNGDSPAQGDYDGDGKTDLGIFRNGVWYLYQTQAGITATSFGLAGDLPSTGDFDGDAKSDIAVFRPSNGVWYLLQSTAGFTAVQFGATGDKPIPNAYLPQ